MSLQVWWAVHSYGYLYVCRWSGIAADVVTELAEHSANLYCTKSYFSIFDAYVHLYVCNMADFCLQSRTPVLNILTISFHLLCTVPAIGGGGGGVLQNFVHIFVGFLSVFFDDFLQLYLGGKTSTSTGFR